MQINILKNAKRNMFFGSINRIVVLLIPFIKRLIVLNVLGSQYLGLGSLFQSILSVLSLSELGFSSAMVYNMYKPAAEGNVVKMNALLNFYRRVYRVIGMVILGAGVCLIPFLPRLIKGIHPEDVNLTTLYLIYLVNTAISYFLFAHKSSLLVVHQRDDVKSSVNTVLSLGLTGSQIAVLLITKNYYLFSLLILLFTIANNLLIAWRTKVLFPQYKEEGELGAEDKEGIKKLVAGSFIQQACGVSRNSLDSICISAFYGLTLTAIYNNYYMIISGVTSFIGIYTAAFTGGIGNHVATRSVDENFQEMKRLDFVYLWIGGWCTICLLCLYQPFMEIWMGKDMMLPMSAVVLFCMYFYLLKLGDVRYLYTAANGLWWEHRYRALTETALNLVLNILLGKFFGVHGIVLATIISLLTCNYVWSASLLFKNYFSLSKIKQYFVYQGTQTALTIIAALITYWLCHTFNSLPLVVQLLFRTVLCASVPNLIFILFYRRTDQFCYAKELLKR